jgi:hypothetical protein
MHPTSTTATTARQVIIAVGMFVAIELNQIDVIAAEPMAAASC